MTRRPTKFVLGLELVALVAALAVCVSRAATGHIEWDLDTMLFLLALSIVGDILVVQTAASGVKTSSSFLAIITAIVFLGEVPAAFIGIATILVGWCVSRYAGQDLLINLVTYAWFPLVAGIAFQEALERTGTTQTDPLYYVLIFGLFTFALAINFAIIAGYSAYVDRSNVWTKVKRALGPVLPSELASALLAVGIARAYVDLGLPALALFGVVLLTFQYLLGALLLSQERGEELELRARQLAGFQVAVLSALLRTLDLRDRMTARHSAAVARYSREIAAAAGLSEEEQELVHTAGLLHDIGKFIFPGHILKADVALTDEDWNIIRTHPYQGARIVSQVDGYGPVGEIVLAHHERVDGKGYPRGLAGDEIPLLSRIISVADVYDVITARDSYRVPVSSFEAIHELRRVAGTQLDARFVDVFVELLAGKDVRYRHGEDADFDAELGLEKRVHAYAAPREEPLPGEARRQDADGGV